MRNVRRIDDDDLVAGHEVVEAAPGRVDLDDRLRHDDMLHGARHGGADMDGEVDVGDARRPLVADDHFLDAGALLGRQVDVDIGVAAGAGVVAALAVALIALRLRALHLLRLAFLAALGVAGAAALLGIGFGLTGTVVRRLSGGLRLVGLGPGVLRALLAGHGLVARSARSALGLEVIGLVGLGGGARARAGRRRTGGTPGHWRRPAGPCRHRNSSSRSGRLRLPPIEPDAPADGPLWAGGEAGLWA